MEKNREDDKYTKGLALEVNEFEDLWMGAAKLVQLSFEPLSFY